MHPSELDAEIEIAFVDLSVYPVCFGERYVFAHSSELDDEVDTVLVELLRIRQPAATVQPPVSRANVLPFFPLFLIHLTSISTKNLTPRS